VKTLDFVKLFGTEQGKQILHKALSSGSTSGGPMIAEHLELVITNTMVRLVPELAVPEFKFDPQSVHEFNRVTGLPAAGSAMGEGSTTPTRQSSMERATVPLKIMKRKGSVTGFLKAAASKNYDAVEVEMENHLQAFGNDMATYILYGNKDADQYTFDGLDKFISTNRTNSAVGGEVPTDLSFLDNMIDASNTKKGAPHRRAFVMSPQMLTKFSSLYTQVRDNRSAIREGSKVIEIDGGWRLQTYRDIPILESSSVRPISKMGAVTAAHAGAGSGIPDDTRYFQVAPVTWDGEQLASTEVSDTSSSSDSITLSFTAFTGALFYKVYASDATGTETLKKIVSATTYDGNGTITGAVTSIVFTTEPLTADAASVPTHMQSDVPYNATGGYNPETVFLWDLDPHQGMGKIAYTNPDGSRLDGFASMLPLAKIDDTDDFLIKSYPALVDSFEATSAMHRGLRVA
jgi:hypothetical protein